MNLMKSGLSLVMCMLSTLAHSQTVSCNVRVTTDKDRVRIGETVMVEFFTGDSQAVYPIVSVPIVPQPVSYEYEIQADNVVIARGINVRSTPILYEKFNVAVNGLNTSGLKTLSVRLSSAFSLKPSPPNCVNTNIGTTLINVMAPDPIPILATSYTGLWWNQATDGQGVFFTQNSPSNIAFIGWFTYDKDGRQKWYAGDRCDMGITSGGFNGNVCTTTLYETSDGKFDGATFNGAQIKRSAVGEAGFKFHSNQAVTMTYSLNGVTGKLELQRQPF